MKRNTRQQLASEDQRTEQVGSKSWESIWQQVAEESRLPTFEELHAEGWRSVAEICELRGRAVSRTRMWLDAEVAAGRFERRECRHRRVRLAAFRPVRH